VNCRYDTHTWSWGGSTTTDAIPLRLRCDCGLLTREDIGPIQRLQAENARLRERLGILERDRERAARSSERRGYPWD
jgi:hypothetical protein